MSFRFRMLALTSTLIGLLVAVLSASPASSASTPAVSPAIVTPALTAPSTPVRSTTVPSSVNLADYALVSRAELPNSIDNLGGLSTCTSGSGDVLAEEASAVAYDPNGNSGAGSLFVLGDGGACVVQVALDGTYIDSMPLATGSSPQGTAFYDTEGITYVGQDGGKPELVFTEERYRQLDEFDYTPGTTPLSLADVNTVKLGTTIGNIGLEGVSYDPAISNASGCTVAASPDCQGFIVAKEKQPKSIFQTNVDWGTEGSADGTATNGGAAGDGGLSVISGDTDQAADLFNSTPASTVPGAGVNDYSDVFALSNVTSLNGASLPDQITGSDGTSYDGDLLIDSQESGQIELVDRSGNVKSWLDLEPNPASGSNVVDETHEGVAMDQDGNLYVVSEDGAGEEKPELEVYAPQTYADLAPTSVTLGARSGSLPSTASSSGDGLQITPLTVKDGDSSEIADDDNVTGSPTDTSDTEGIGDDIYSVHATDKNGTDVSADFVANHLGLYLKQGASLAGVTSPVTITVSVNDPSATDTTTPVTANFTLNVVSYTPVTGPEGKIIISEVDASGSGGSGCNGQNTYCGDWFELTNTGTTPIDLNGWSMSDSAENPSNAAAFNGVPSIAPGESVVFVEQDTAGDTGGPVGGPASVAAFKAAWGLGAGVQVGYLGADANGLSTSGDQVNVYDAGKNWVTGVAFGGSGEETTFDNYAGIGAGISTPPVISALSVAGEHGASTDSEGETGSPGYADVAPTVAITEVNPSGSSTAAYGGSNHGDWFELTNYGVHPVDLTGWKMDDNHDDVTKGAALTVDDSGSSVLEPGQSIVFIEDSDAPSPTAATVESEFEAAWFPGGVPSGFRIGSYEAGTTGVGLGSGGDAVNVYDDSGDLIDSVTWTIKTSPATLINPTLAGTASILGVAPSTATLATAATSGSAGAWTTTNSDAEVGSPGAFPTVAITEVDPNGSGGSYKADWFELTDTGSLPIDLNGWSMDDNSDTFASSAPITVNADTPILQPGQSIVLAEYQPGGVGYTADQLAAGEAALEAAFEQDWFGSNVPPAAFTFGTYDSGPNGNTYKVGLSPNSDGVHVFNDSGTELVGVNWASAVSSAVTEDNTSGTLTPSASGTDGAWPSADGNEVGSPGIVGPDTTAPTLTASGNAGTYAYGSTIAITCTSNDGFGAVNPAASVPSGDVGCATGISGNAGTTYAVGAHTVTFAATDYAGNIGTEAVTFTVQAAPSSDTNGNTNNNTTTTTNNNTTSSDNTNPAGSTRNAGSPSPPTGSSAGAGPKRPAASSAPPKLGSLASSATPAKIEKGLTETLTKLKAKSRVTLVVRFGKKTVGTFTAKASAAGKVSLKFHLTKASATKYKQKKLTLSFTATGANGKKHTLTKTLKIS